MHTSLILASGSAIRADMLRNAGVSVEIQTARIDETMIKDALVAEGAPPRDVADKLAEAKARKVADKNPNAMVIGCDQVLSFRGALLSKPVSPDDAAAQLRMMRGERHALLSAAVIYHEGKPIWRHIGQVRLRMRDVSDTYLDDYIARNWDDIRHCVGAYQLEAEGVRLFHGIEGDYFNVLGMPLLELLAFLTLRGVIDG
ncbi:Maf family nucleotide pyrophosphatase [uncultured Tateyamaria sp.]|uniref:Maf family protein n=1 Tax=uncultured Tateyamaria sp. TaxID=455651 RepID=UPI00262BC069|nr:Maf family nucleotide pyrophosphatase [uncultured Tateyamaria sp.]